MYEGQLATALVLVAVERGIIYVNWGFPGSAPMECKLGDLCQDCYLSNVMECMECYGRTDDETCGAEQLADYIKTWTETGFPGLEKEKIESGHPLIQTYFEKLS